MCGIVRLVLLSFTRARQENTHLTFSALPLLRILQLCFLICDFIVFQYNCCTQQYLLFLAYVSISLLHTPSCASSIQPTRQLELASWKCLRGAFWILNCGSLRRLSTRVQTTMTLQPNQSIPWRLTLWVTEKTLPEELIQRLNKLAVILLQGIQELGTWWISKVIWAEWNISSVKQAYPNTSILGCRYNQFKISIVRGYLCRFVKMSGWWFASLASTTLREVGAALGHKQDLHPTSHLLLHQEYRQLPPISSLSR